MFLNELLKRKATPGAGIPTAEELKRAEQEVLEFAAREVGMNMTMLKNGLTELAALQGVIVCSLRDAGHNATADYVQNKIGLTTSTYKVLWHG